MGSTGSRLSEDGTQYPAYVPEEYLDLVGQTIEAKAWDGMWRSTASGTRTPTQMYGYIGTYINSLNNERFRSNSRELQPAVWLRSRTFRNGQHAGCMIRRHLWAA